MTQAQVAAASGGLLQREYLSKYESGDNAITSADAQRGLASAFKLSPTDLADYLDGRLSAAEVVSRRAGLVGPTIALSAARTMARALEFDEAFLDEWSPSGDELENDADTIWTLCKADYVRWKRSRVHALNG